MPGSPITTRLADWLDEELKEIFRAAGEGRSEGLRRVVEEWWTLQNFPHLEFRDGPWGRRAALRGGPEVWEVVSAAREYEADRAGLAEHFAWLEPAALEESLAYAARFPDAVQALIAENDRIARRLAERRA
jgi:hypothetical protein